MNLVTESTILATTFALYFIAAFLWPTVRVWRLSGKNPYVLPATDDVYGLVTKGMRFVLVSLVVYVMLQALQPDLGRNVGEIEWLLTPALRWAGWAGVAVALIWTIVAQYQMDLSWRIGIDQDHPTRLVTSGLFTVSRNPIFLAMRLSLFSLMLIRPNAVTLAIWLVGEVLMQFQVRLEEAFLLHQHGSAYATYHARVRRWI
jgi:protein-S-isoprenylcysteine O-methyltransferase Ste14